MTSHTPGPWTVRTTFSGQRFVMDPRPDIDGRITAQIICGPNSNPDWEANARAISATPELLCMLERLLDGILRLPEIPPTLCNLDIEQARLAIAKAGGGK